MIKLFNTLYSLCQFPVLHSSGACEHILFLG